MDTGNQDRTVQTTATTRSGDRCKAELPDAVGHLIFWPILLSGLLADLWTKQAVFAWLESKLGQSAEIVDGFLSFRMALNTGAAFGIFSGRLPFLVGVSAVALLVILGVFFFGAARQRMIQVSLGLFAAGVSGNLWDRLFNGGQVRDFIDVVYWPRPALAHLQRGGFDAVRGRGAAGRRDSGHWFVRSNTCSATKIGESRAAHSAMASEGRESTCTLRPSMLR